jgi:hypothetical protein
MGLRTARVDAVDRAHRGLPCQRDGRRLPSFTSIGRGSSPFRVGPCASGVARLQAGRDSCRWWLRAWADPKTLGLLMSHRPWSGSRRSTAGGPAGRSPEAVGRLPEVSPTWVPQPPASLRHEGGMAEGGVPRGSIRPPAGGCCCRTYRGGIEGVRDTEPFSSNLPAAQGGLHLSLVAPEAEAEFRGRRPADPGRHAFSKPPLQAAGRTSRADRRRPAAVPFRPERSDRGPAQFLPEPIGGLTDRAGPPLNPGPPGQDPHSRHGLE